MPEYPASCEPKKKPSLKDTTVSRCLVAIEGIEGLAIETIELGGARDFLHLRHMKILTEQHPDTDNTSLSELIAGGLSA